MLYKLGYSALFKRVVKMLFDKLLIVIVKKIDDDNNSNINIYIDIIIYHDNSINNMFNNS